MAQLRFGREGTEFGRGIGFFDAIYAFAITLLITNLDVPPPAAWRSVGALLGSGLGSQLLGFVISFVVIAAFWKSNANLMSEFRALDGLVIAANLLSAGLVVLLPFTTQGISDPELSDLPLPTALYAVNVAAAMIALHLVREVGQRRGLLETPLTRSERWAWRIDLLAQVAVFAISIPIAFLVGPQWAWTTWALLIVIAPLSGRFVERVGADARGTHGIDVSNVALVPPDREDVAE